MLPGNLVAVTSWGASSRSLLPSLVSGGGLISRIDGWLSESNSVSAGRGVLAASERARRTSSEQGLVLWRKGSLRLGVGSVIIGMTSFGELCSWITWDWLC
ncbi:unnamed protein product [Tuber melanosporum]|uniref:(Perigord truffle) hypothetical protein n=1 Tax=Tuber melanosporum (strain Mel28) TaxID=656061 RepID=D5GI11_TUBMM|nr:uncharacterized protein GSTUM_00008223001 [Tuber melanosporum]CAZ84154.1 unnamed protein product [Tuber melanosporum]